MVRLHQTVEKRKEDKTNIKGTILNFQKYFSLLTKKLINKQNEFGFLTDKLKNLSEEGASPIETIENNLSSQK